MPPNPTIPRKPQISNSQDSPYPGHGISKSPGNPKFKTPTPNSQETHNHEVLRTGRKEPVARRTSQAYQDISNLTPRRQETPNRKSHPWNKNRGLQCP